MVVLSHALACSLGMGRRGALPEQALHRPALRPPGPWRFGKPAGPYSMEIFADDAAGLIEQHSHAPVTFVGW